MEKPTSDWDAFYWNIATNSNARPPISNRRSRPTPTAPKSYEVLGRTHLARGKEKDAIETANKALQINPRYGPAHLLLARLYRKKGDTLQALSHYNTYLSHGAQDETPALEFALEFLAEKRYNVVTEIASRMTDARRLPLLAQVLLASRRYEDALSVFQKYLDTLSATGKKQSMKTFP